mgnify:CR=1 FL=1
MHGIQTRLSTRASCSPLAIVTMIAGRCGADRRDVLADVDFFRVPDRQRSQVGRRVLHAQQRQVEVYKFFAPGTVEEEVCSGRIQQA